jgi:hypothetical protein
MGWRAALPGVLSQENECLPLHLRGRGIDPHFARQQSRSAISSETRRSLDSQLDKTTSRSPVDFDPHLIDAWSACDRRSGFIATLNARKMHRPRVWQATASRAHRVWRDRACGNLREERMKFEWMRIVQVSTIIACVMLSARVQADVAAPRANAFPPLHSPTNPYPQDPPLFAAFKAFCVDTVAKPSAVEAAVLAAGGVPGNHGSTDYPMPMSTSGWGISLRGHRMSVNASSAYPSRKHKGFFDFDSCSIHSFADDDLGVKAIQDWVGVPPYQVSSPDKNSPTPDLKIFYYSYQAVGPAHKALVSKADRLSGQIQGQAWSLVLMKEPRGASIQLSHDLPPANPSPPPQQ